MPGRIFILSPANCSGKRAQHLLRADAAGTMAMRLRCEPGVPLGELFAHISGLYFRGKLAYASRFAAPPLTRQRVAAVSGVHVITPHDGLRGPDVRTTVEDVRMFASQSIDLANRAYREALAVSARSLRASMGECQVVLLGSIASPKYVDVLLDVFGTTLVFPVDFVGRGDMSRGGLLLRQVAAGVELPYVPVSGAERRGARPPKLAPIHTSPPTGANQSASPRRPASPTARRKASR